MITKKPIEVTFVMLKDCLSSKFRHEIEKILEYIGNETFQFFDFK